MINTNVALGFALTPQFLAKVAFSQEAREQVHLMVDSIKQAFKVRLNELEWIDDEHAKAAMKDKIDKAKAVIGFPAFATDTEKMEEMYQDYRVNQHDYLGNILNYVQFNLRKNARLVFQSTVFNRHAVFY